MRHATYFMAAAILTVLNGCGFFDSRNARLAESRLVGLSSQQLQACAGVPAKKEKIGDHIELYQYTGSKAAETASGVTLIPVGDIANLIQNLLNGGGTNCTAVMRLDYDRVSEVHYTGDSDEVVGSDGICAVIVRGCVRHPPAIYSAQEVPVLKPSPSTAATGTPQKPAK